MNYAIKLKNNKLQRGNEQGRHIKMGRSGNHEHLRVDAREKERAYIFIVPIQ
jgi:hypothetical protein